MSLANLLEQTHSNKQLQTILLPGTRKKLEHFSYDLTDVIGKGYSSQVFKGKNDMTNQPVAIKVIDMKMLKCEVNRSLLQNEIENLKSLAQAPNVLQLVQVYNTKNNTYIITELCDSDLSKKLKIKMEEKEVYNQIQQLIQGYLQLYRKEIIHRDLKPANVLIRNGILKIADLGFSIKAKEALKPSRYNVGSPLYMAPQCLKKNQYSYKSDIWALGVIVYEMVFHQPPWTARNQKQLLKKIEADDIHSLILKDINPLTKEFLIRTLCIDKNYRLGPEELERFTFLTSSIYHNHHHHHQTIHSELITSSSIPTPKPFKQKILNSQQSNKYNNNNNSLNTLMDLANVNNILKQRNTLLPQISSDFKKQQYKDIPNRQRQRENRKKIFDNKIPLPIISDFSCHTTTTIAANTISKQERKQTTKILISEVHFCRFLFKLIDRIKKSPQLKSTTEELLQHFSIVIMDKITKVKDIEHFNSINIKHYEEYKVSADFPKIKKIGKEYYLRYSEQLNEAGLLHPSSSKTYQIPKIMKMTERNIKSISKHLAENVNEESLSIYSPEIIVLDYLITTYQLFNLLCDSEDPAKFSRKSKIQQIVEGTPSTITMSHFFKILQKIEDLNLYF